MIFMQRFSGLEDKSEEESILSTINLSVRG
jgi:hypothetical protein